MYGIDPSVMNLNSCVFIRDVKTKEDLKCVEISLFDKLFNDNFFAVGIYRSSDYRLMKANHKYYDYLKSKYNLESIPLGQCITDFAPGFKGSIFERAWTISSKGQTSYLDEFKTVSLNKIEKYWNGFNIPINEEGQVKYIISVLNDITDHVLQKKHIEDRNAELERTIEAKDELLLLMTHELKTPLSVIASSIQVIESLCKNELTDKISKYLDKIRQNTYRQLKLVNNILDNTRVSSGHFKLKQRNVEVVSLTGIIIDSIMVFAEKKKIKISYCFSCERMVINADVDQYERILLNLLSNAVKFTPEGRTIEVKVFDTINKGTPQACIQVRDQGIGIPHDKRELIFERFGRVEKQMRNSEGTGIGLYLVKMLVTLMNGTIELESEEGTGSTFNLYFPLLYIESLETESGDFPKEGLTAATDIEFSDIYYGM